MGAATTVLVAFRALGLRKELWSRKESQHGAVRASSPNAALREGGGEAARSHRRRHSRPRGQTALGARARTPGTGERLHRLAGLPAAGGAGLGGGAAAVR